MTFTRVLAGIGVTVLSAATLTLGADAAFSAENPSAPPVVAPISTTITPPTSYPVQQELPVVPDNPNDASINRGAIPYDEIAPAINNLMDYSNRVSAQVVGQSAGGKDIYLVTVTARETPEQTAQQLAWRDKIKHDSAAAATDTALKEGYKMPIWFNGNIHGNEWEGTDATLNYIDFLAKDSSPETAELLANYRLYFTVTNNPDGRVAGVRPSDSGFDINRDMITGASPESTIIRDLSALIQPTFFFDLHGYTGILQIEPCGPPHGENYEYDLFLPYAYDAALAMEKAVVEANIPGNTYQDANGDPTLENTGKVLIPYRDIRAGWDDWPPIFTPQYVAYQGAITNTVELPLGRSNNAETNKANSAVDVQVAGVVIESAVDYVVENTAPALDNQIEIFRRGAAGEQQRSIPADVEAGDFPGPTQWTEIWDETDIYNSEFPRAYVLPMGEGQRSDTDAVALVDQLLANGVEVKKTTTPYTADGTTYPAGSYLVDMHQPLRGMANVFLANGTDISERVPDMYDISAWSPGLLWGATVDAVGSTTDPALAVAAEIIHETAPTGTVPEADSYLELELEGVSEYQAVNYLLDNGIAVSTFEDGSVIVGPEGHGAAAAVAQAYGVQFEGSDGTRLLQEEARGLDDLTIGYTGSQDERVSLTKLGFDDLVQVTSATITTGAVDLDTIDVLWLGANLSFNAQQQAGRDEVAAYLSTGRGVAGKGTAIAGFASTFGLVTTTATSGTGGSNGIVSVETTEDGLFAPYGQGSAFVYPAVWYTGLGENATIEQRYATEDTFISGHWVRSEGRSYTDAAGQASIVSAEAATGSKVVMFGTSPNYRAHTIGGFSQIARSLFWVGPEGAEVADPVITTPTAEPTEEPTTAPTEEPTTAPTGGAVTPVDDSELTDSTKAGVTVSPSRTAAGTSVTVTVGTDHAGEEVSAWLYSTPTTLDGHTVSTSGTFGVTIPSDTTTGHHKLAVLDAEGALVGWAEIEITAPTGLASTGFQIGGMITLAVVLLLSGAAVVLVIRSRKARPAARG